MIKEFLQFIKKTKFAVCLAQNGLYDLIAELKTFRVAKNVAFFFRAKDKSERGVKNNLDSFWLKEEDEAFRLFALTLFSMAPLCGFPLYFPPQSPQKIKTGEDIIAPQISADEVMFYAKLLQELADKDFPKIKDSYKSFLHAADKFFDLRLYAADLEELNKANKIFSLNWILSSEEKISLQFAQPAQIQNKINAEQQNLLAEKFAQLFFAEELYPVFWSCCHTDNDMALINIYDVQAIGEKEQIFLRNHMTQAQKPQTPEQSKLVYALEYLKINITDSILSQQFSPFIKQKFKPKGKGEKTLGVSLAKYGVVVPPQQKIIFPQAKDLIYLLDKKRHRNDKRFAKSSSKYLLLLLLAYLLVRYF